MENNECIGPVYRNDRICTECGGQCCKIYTSPDQGGSYPNDVWFEEYCEDFHMHADRYDVEPLFDPLITHMRGNEQMLVDLDIDNETDIDTVVTWLGQLHLTLDTTSLHDELTKTATTIAALERELAVVRTLSTGDDCHGPIGTC